MMYYIRIRMAIAVVRVICGSRDRQRPRRPVISDRHDMNDLRAWWSEQYQYESHWPVLELNALASFAGKL